MSTHEEIAKLSHQLRELEREKKAIQDRITELLQKGQPARFQPAGAVQVNELPPPSLAKLLRIDPDVPIHRYQLTKKLYTYLDERGMIDSEHRGTIDPSNKVRRALQMSPNDDDLSVFNLQSYLTPLYACED